MCVIDLARLAHLGVPLSPPQRVRGGGANRLYRLDTERGSFAVKELNLRDRREAYRMAEVLRLERAAFAAGVPMPEPVDAVGGVVVHRWVNGAPVPEAPAPPPFAHAVGGALATLHALDVAWEHGTAVEPVVHDWEELTDRAVASGQPWASELVAQRRTFEAIARFVETCERPGPVVLTHRDVQPWNLLERDGNPVLVDWELAGPLDLGSELGASALGIAKGPGLDSIEPASFRAVLDGYVDAGGELPPSGPHWFVYLLGGWLSFTRWNLLRCLTDVEAATGPELALSHQAVRDGLQGLPELFRRLPDLESLLPG